MLLIVTNSQDATADYLATVLERHDIEYLRFDTDRCISNLEIHYQDGCPRLFLEKRWFLPKDFQNVWYRRPERLKGKYFDDSPEGEFSRNEWSEALEGFFAHIPKACWMNHPACNVMASHKLDQLTKAKTMGLLVPNTLVTQDASQVREFFHRNNGKIISKPMARGYVERPLDQTDTLIYTNRVSEDNLETLDDLRACPTLFQGYIDKNSDIRITIVDSAMCAVELRAADPDGTQMCDIRRNNMDDVKYRRISLPEQISNTLERMMEYYQLRFSAIDMVIDKDGRWYFLEINPNGQWAWLDLSGGMDIATFFVKAFAEDEKQKASF